MKDKFEGYACDFKNETECEEELNEEGLDFDDVKKNHFGEDEE